MKRRYMVLATLLVFVLAAVAAWLSGPPGRRGEADSASIRLGPRKRAGIAIHTNDVVATLRVMEERIVANNPAPPRKKYDAKGMDELLSADGAAYCGSGLRDIEFSTEWAEDSPEAMFDWLAKQNRKRSSFARILFESWADKDTEAALAAVGKIPNPKVRAQALISSLKVLCENDPERARDLLHQNLDLLPTGDKDRSVFFGSDSGQAVIQLLSSMPMGEQRTHLLAGLLNDMGDSSDALGYWKGLPESGRVELVSAGFAPYMTDAVAFDGLENIMRERAETAGDPEVSRAFIESHGEAWAKRDLAGALNWAQEHLKGKTRVECREKFFQIGINEDFDATLRIWKTLPEGYLKAKAAEAILRAAPEQRKSEAEAVLKPE
jgi:hypothetical protein